MSRFRLSTNVVVIVVLTLGLTGYAAMNWVGSTFFQDRYEIVVPMAETGGLFRNQEVTVLGHGVGSVKNIHLTDTGVEAVLDIRGDEVVPRNAIVQILRRSAIGEQALNFIPVAASYQPPPRERLVPAQVPVAEGWQAADRGARIDPKATAFPTEIQPLLNKATRLFETIDPNKLASVVHELSEAVAGRGDLLVELNRGSFDLNTTLVDGIPEFQRLIDTSEPVLAELNEHRQSLAEMFVHLADVSDELASERPTMERLLDTGLNALVQGEAFTRNTRENQHCLFNDFTDFNRDVAEGVSLQHLEETLAMNRSFYLDGFDIITQYDPYREGISWQRINLLIFEEAGGQPNEPHRPTPRTLPGAACTSPWGVGVNAVRQPDHQPPDETAPPIDFAPLVAGDRSRVEPSVSGDPASGGGDGQFAVGDGTDGGALPATGGGGLAVLLGPLTVAAALAARRRR